MSVHKLTYPDRLKHYRELWNAAQEMAPGQIITVKCGSHAEALRERMKLYAARREMHNLLPRKPGSDTEPMYTRLDELEVVIDPTTHNVIVREIPAQPLTWEVVAAT